jgi:hypothetical protein
VTHHNLKTWPSFFEAVLSGAKTFEVRLDDRGFQAGDTVTLREYDPDMPRKSVLGEPYTGRNLLARIGYVLHAVPPVAYHFGRGPQTGHNLEGYVVFSLLDVEEVK